MKLPGIPRGRSKRRSTDPLGDPFEGLDLGALDRADAEDDDARGGDSADAEPAPATSQRREPAPPVRPDVELDVSLDPADDDPDSARGLLSRLFGSGGAADDDRDPDLAGMRDLDGRPLRSGKGRRRRGAIAAAAVVGLLAGGGLWAWQAGVFGGGGDGPVTAAAPEAEDGSAGAAGGDPGAVPRLEMPDRVVMALPPLEDSMDGAGEDAATGDVIADPTAATDRSTSRRPWLDDAPGAAEDPAQTTAGSDEAEGPDTASPETEAAGPGPEIPAATPPATAEAEPDGTDTPATDTPGTGPAAADGGGAEPAAVDTAATDAAAPDGADADPADNPWAAMSARGRAGAEEGVRARVDLAAPEIDVPDVPGLLPVPDGVGGVVEPEAPARLGEAPAVPSYSDLARAAGTRGNPLPDAPRRALLADGPHGPVPRVGEDGTAPWQAYAARDPAPPERPRVAIVVHGLGMMGDPLEAAITRLPPAVTLSFTPYAPDLAQKMGLAREAGHEVMLDLPMEAEAFPARDPGPLGLLTLLPPPETVDRLQQVLAAGTGYVGVLAGSDDGFAASPEHMEPVLAALRQAGLLYLHQGSPRALAANRRVLPSLGAVDVVVDRRGFAASIDARLNYLTRVAQARGSAVGIMGASPLGFARLKAWAADLEAAGVALAPLSAVVGRGTGRDGAPRTEAHNEGSADHG